MENIKLILVVYGFGMDWVVKCIVMIDDMVEWFKFNEIYKDFFKGDYLVCSVFGVDGLVFGVVVEVECIVWC